jgi:hypothetical protein
MDAARGRHNIFAPVAWAGLAGLYLLLAGQVSFHEVIAGTAASVAAAAYATVAHRAMAPLPLRLPWLAVARRVISALVLDTIRVGVSLIRAAPGSQSRQKLPDADRGRRAVEILTVSTAPNGFVLRADQTDMLLHRLVDMDSSR